MSNGTKICDWETFVPSTSLTFSDVIDRKTEGKEVSPVYDGVANLPIGHSPSLWINEKTCKLHPKYKSLAPLFMLNKCAPGEEEKMAHYRQFHLDYEETRKNFLLYRAPEVFGITEEWNEEKLYSKPDPTCPAVYKPFITRESSGFFCNIPTTKDGSIDTNRMLTFIEKEDSPGVLSKVDKLTIDEFVDLVKQRPVVMTHKPKPLRYKQKHFSANSQVIYLSFLRPTEPVTPAASDEDVELAIPEGFTYEGAKRKADEDLESEKTKVLTM